MREPRHISPAVLLVIAAMFAGGCQRRTAQASAPVVIFPPSAPTVAEEPAPQPEEKKTAEAKPEEIPKPEPEAVAPPAKRPNTRPAPKPAPADPPSDSGPKPSPPRITPGVSPAELGRLQQEALDAIALSQKNLDYASRKTLNATQRDLKEKVQGFLAQAQEARNDGDWVRVRNLADKARVLSIELVNSL